MQFTLVQKENGLLTTTIVMASAEKHNTNGAAKKYFCFQTTSNSLWAVYGDYDASYNPYGFRQLGGTVN
jgi:hypothetical protein